MMTYVKATWLKNHQPTNKLKLGQIPNQLTAGNAQIHLNVLLKEIKFTTKMTMVQTPSLTQS